MYRRTVRGNRLGLAVIGFLLLIGGLALAGAADGLYGHSTHVPLYSDAARTFIRHNHGWLWPVVAVVALVIGLAALRWLLVQGRVDTLRTLRLDLDDGSDVEAGISGRTTMATRVLTAALEDDVSGERGVRRTRATFTDRPDRPVLWLDVVTDTDADLARIQRHVVEVAVPAARTTLDSPTLPVYLTLHVSRRGSGTDLS